MKEGLDEFTTNDSFTICWCNNCKREIWGDELIRGIPICIICRSGVKFKKINKKVGIFTTREEQEELT